MAKNENLHKAKEKKFNEFYTQLTDIEKELKHYKQHFEDKIVFCNCDDPEWSNFWTFFNLNFEFLKIKKLMATHFEEKKQSYYLTMFRDSSGVHTEIKTLSQNGDFRSPECLALLEEADIVCTNPPFSLFDEYIKVLIDSGKKFLIIGNQDHITLPSVFGYIKDNKTWLGANSGSMKFRVPDDYSSKNTKVINGVNYASFGNICWYTNMDFKKRHESIILFKKYNENYYPKYLNYDAIEVSKISDIPCDYYGIMGVPPTFLCSYNPEQFEIIGEDGGDMGKSFGISANLTEEECKELYREHKGFRRGKLCYRTETGEIKVCFRRLLIRRRQGNED